MEVVRSFGSFGSFEYSQFFWVGLGQGGAGNRHHLKAGRVKAQPSPNSSQVESTEM